MPKPYMIDWERVKIRYVIGTSPKLLAQEFSVPVSCIQKRITRGRWGELRTENKRAVTNLVEQTLVTLQQKSERVREKLANELVKQTLTLERVPAKKNLKDLAKRSVVASTVAGTAAKVFEWDEREGEQFLVDPIQMSSSVTVMRSDNTNTAAIDAPALPSSVEASQVAEEDIAAM